MANASAIYALTSGLAQHLSRAFQLRPVPETTCKFEPAGSSAIKKLDGQDTKCTIFLYRLTHNEHLRNRPAASLPFGKSPPLTVDLHLLITIWADSPLKEETLIAWVLRELHMHPVLDSSLLGENAGFGPSDVVQLMPEELTLDDMTKLWQVLVPPYRPSLTYVVRNIALDLESQRDTAPVVASRFTLSDDVEAVREPA